MQLDGRIGSSLPRVRRSDVRSLLHSERSVTHANGLANGSMCDRTLARLRQGAVLRPAAGSQRWFLLLAHVRRMARALAATDLDFGRPGRARGARTPRGLAHGPGLAAHAASSRNRLVRASVSTGDVHSSPACAGAATRRKLGWAHSHSERNASCSHPRSAVDRSGNSFGVALGTGRARGLVRGRRATKPCSWRTRSRTLHVPRVCVWHLTGPVPTWSSWRQIGEQNCACYSAETTFRAVREMGLRAHFL
jgi:hypothetical protein